MDLFVKTSWEELGAIVREIYVADCFGVAHVCSQALFIREHVPDFTGAIMRSREHQMAWFGKEFDFLNTFSVALEGMHPLFWDEIWPMFAGLKVLWHFGKLSSFLPMKHCWSLEWFHFFFLEFSFLWLFRSLLSSHGLVFFDGFFLSWGHCLYVLLFEFLHAFV